MVGGCSREWFLGESSQDIIRRGRCQPRNIDRLAPLGWAAHRGHKRIVRPLFKLEDLGGPSAKGMRGR